MRVTYLHLRKSNPLNNYRGWRLEVGLEPGTITHWVLVARGNPVGWVENYRTGSGSLREVQQ